MTVFLKTKNKLVVRSMAIKEKAKNVMFWSKKDISKVKKILLEWILQNILENQTFQRMAKFIMVDSYKMDFMNKSFFMYIHVILIILLLNYERAYMRAIIGYSGRGCVLIIVFELCGSKAGLFQVNLFWMGKYDPLRPTFILEEKLIQY